MSARRALIVRGIARATTSTILAALLLAAASITDIT